MYSKVNELMEKFIAGVDSSLEAANAIEASLDDAFPKDDFIQQTVEMLAMYRPEGGDFLFDVAAIRKRLNETIEYMNDNR